MHNNYIYTYMMEPEGDYVLNVKKESGSGLFANERLLLIKSGFISYFSKKPKTFVGNVRSLELSGELPKQTLPVTSITDVKIDNRYLKFKFNAKDILEVKQLEKLIKDPTSQPKSKGENKEEEWTFKCKNNAEASYFAKYVQAYRKNPKFKPNLEKIVGNYRDGKEGFQRLSVQLKNPEKSLRFSDGSADFKKIINFAAELKNPKKKEEPVDGQQIAEIAKQPNILEKILMGQRSRESSNDTGRRSMRSGTVTSKDEEGEKKEKSTKRVSFQLDEISEEKKLQKQEQKSRQKKQEKRIQKKQEKKTLKSQQKKTEKQEQKKQQKKTEKKTEKRIQKSEEKKRQKSEGKKLQKSGSEKKIQLKSVVNQQKSPTKKKNEPQLKEIEETSEKKGGKQLYSKIYFPEKPFTGKKADLKQNSPKVANSASDKLDDYFQAILKKELEKKKVESKEEEDQSDDWESYKRKMKEEEKQRKEEKQKEKQKQKKQKQIEKQIEEKRIKEMIKKDQEAREKLKLQKIQKLSLNEGQRKISEEENESEQKTSMKNSETEEEEKEISLSQNKVGEENNLNGKELKEEGTNEEASSSLVRKEQQKQTNNYLEDQIYESVEEKNKTMSIQSSLLKKGGIQEHISEADDDEEDEEIPHFPNKVYPSSNNKTKHKQIEVGEGEFNNNGEQKIKEISVRSLSVESQDSRPSTPTFNKRALREKDIVGFISNWKIRVPKSIHNQLNCEQMSYWLKIQAVERFLQALKELGKKNSASDKYIDLDCEGIILGKKICLQNETIDLHIEEKITGKRMWPSRIRGIFNVYKQIEDKLNQKERLKKGIRLPLLYHLHYNNFEGVYIENVTKLRKRIRPEKSFCKEMMAFCRKMGFEKEQIQFYDAGDQTAYLYIDPYLCQRAQIPDFNFNSKYLNLKIDENMREECHDLIKEKLNSVNMITIEGLEQIFHLFEEDDSRVRAKKLNYICQILNISLNHEEEATFEVKIESLSQNQALIMQFYERVPDLLRSWRIQEAKDAVYWKIVKMFQEEQTTISEQFEEACFSICEVFLSADEFHQAIEICEKLLEVLHKQHLKRPQVFYYLLQAYFGILDDEGMRKTFERGVKQIEENFGKQPVLTMMYKLLGDYESEVGNFQKAKQLYRVCIKTEKNKEMLLDMYLSFIDLYIKQKEEEKAKKYIDFARKKFIQQRRLAELNFRLAKILPSFDNFHRRLEHFRYFIRKRKEKELVQCLQGLCSDYGYESEEKSLQIFGALEVMEDSEKKEKIMKIGLKMVDRMVGEKISKFLSVKIKDE